jgi:hypothetical protein
MAANADILTYLYVFSPVIVEKCACCSCMLSMCTRLCIYGCKGASLKPVTYIFDIREFIHIGRFPVILNILTPKLEMDSDK